jgi:hypothetical protein
VSCDFDPGEPRHAQVEQRDVGFRRLDLLQRLPAVACSAGDLDPVLVEDVRDRLHDRWMVVGHEAGGGGSVGHPRWGGSTKAGALLSAQATVRALGSSVSGIIET